MGGSPKGLLETADGETIVARWLRIFRELEIPAVLVGGGAAYASLGCVTIADDPVAPGPLGGLVALLESARGAQAIAVACDMPYVSRGLVERLVAAPPAAIVAPRRGGIFEPFFARYDADAVLPEARARGLRGELSLQGLLAACGAVALALDAEQEAELSDWDTPDDVG